MFLILKRKEGVPIPFSLPPSLTSSVARINADRMVVDRAFSVLEEEEKAVDYSIERGDYNRYCELFKINMMGAKFMPSIIAMEFMVQSHLNQEILADIWDLADVDRDGKLTEHEFIVALHLCKLGQRGIKVPKTLPECLKLSPFPHPLSLEANASRLPSMTNLKLSESPKEDNRPHAGIKRSNFAASPFHQPTQTTESTSNFTEEDPSEVVLDCKFTHDINELVTASSGGRINVWKITSNSSTVTNRFIHISAVHSISWDPTIGSKKFIAAVGPTTIIRDLESKNAPEEIRRHTNTVLGVSWKPHSKVYASVSKDKYCVVVNLNDTKLNKYFLHPDTPYCCDWSKWGGDWVATGCKDGIVRIWRETDISNLPVATLQGHKGKVSVCAWSPQEPYNYLASGSHDKTVILWSTPVGKNSLKKLKTFKGHSNPVKSLAWLTKLPNRLVSSSSDSIRIWDTRILTCIKVISITSNEAPRLACHSGGRLVQVQSNPVRIFDIVFETTPPESPVSQKRSSPVSPATPTSNRKSIISYKPFKKTEAVLEISEPSNFNHKSTIGWDEKTGYHIKNIPQEWKKIFQAAGIKPSDLKDEDTATTILGIISKTLPPAPSAPAASSTAEVKNLIDVDFVQMGTKPNNFPEHALISKFERLAATINININEPTSNILITAFSDLRAIMTDIEGELRSEQDASLKERLLEVNSRGMKLIRKLEEKRVPAKFSPENDGVPVKQNLRLIKRPPPPPPPSLSSKSKENLLKVSAAQLPVPPKVEEQDLPPPDESEEVIHALDLPPPPPPLEEFTTPIEGGSEANPDDSTKDFRSALMESIKKGSTLRNINSLQKDDHSDGLVNSLAEAMKKRRDVIDDENVSEEEDEWSDNERL
eukprot:TRINITY_DN5649_c0_g1_i2.p1 TRINITY_DN5649_c0_g1~~TRINITY_DN5649_c0_g1_i2.p1  ORF type:complete len:877 (+),score=183.48 TRINITY_DN5649_c0_g1_i2:302-2932(+)